MQGMSPSSAHSRHASFFSWRFCFFSAGGSANRRFALLSPPRQLSSVPCRPESSQCPESSEAARRSKAVGPGGGLSVWPGQSAGVRNRASGGAPSTSPGRSRKAPRSRAVTKGAGNAAPGCRTGRRAHERSRDDAIPHGRDSSSTPAFTPDPCGIATSPVGLAPPAERATLPTTGTPDGHVRNRSRNRGRSACPSRGCHTIRPPCSARSRG